ncbi:hypothetical protein HYFRA_00007297 [Hymenoscyphus fraxineus]|uniref:Glycine zipper 2TM domain-containing protein n=1 Tax=Hymenoscyphus fraxineus TaxID=746836 RepID=A0A9N9KP06_9HELO|nr:hypothetical protein HYFRA_00007297 [Hymenoscyphus fraxineus]
MEPFIALGLKASDTLIDKHFHKIPDKYMRPQTYHPSNLPNPLKKSRKGSRRQQQNGNRSRSPSPDPYDDYEYVDGTEELRDIPKHSGYASQDHSRSPVGDNMPQQYSRKPPQTRPEYIPPPPIGGTYSPSNQFPPPPRENQYSGSPFRSSGDLKVPLDPLQETSTSTRRRSGERDRERGRDHYDDDRRGRRSTNTRRSSSQEPTRYREGDLVSYNDSNEDLDTRSTLPRSARRPKHTSRRSSSHQPSRNGALIPFPADGDDLSTISGLRRPKTSPVENALKPYDEMDDIYISRTRRPKYTSQRSSSHNPPRDRDSERYYPPSASDKYRKHRRESSLSAIPRYDGRDRIENDRAEGQFFTKSKDGLVGGALGAVIGGWAAKRVQRSASGRDGRRSRRNSSAQEDDKVLTLLGAAVGGLAVNAVVEHLEESKVKKERALSRRRDSRVYEWDDGFS